MKIVEADGEIAAQRGPLVEQQPRQRVQRRGRPEHEQQTERPGTAEAKTASTAAASTGYSTGDPEKNDAKPGADVPFSRWAISRCPA